ncbi:polysaccharide biosynthesis/export family protein [Pontiella desulfatans]|nr:polysaccharide biosynthesis/export family protein [Pontiella desulfatans]
MNSVWTGGGSAAVALFALVLSGCSTLPGSGPSNRQMAKDQNEDPGEREYTVVKLDVDSIHKLGGRRPVKLNETFRKTISGKSGFVLGIGDQLAINIWETSNDGLFSTLESKRARIDAMVDENGQVFVPYVGQVDVAGKSIEAVRSAIENGLKGKAVEPQVQVALKTNVSNNLAVVGDVNAPGRYAVPVGGVRLLDVIAWAGGSRAPIFEAEATIVRGETQDSIRLDEVLTQPGNNVWMEPSDTVQIMHKPRTFTALGAVTSKNRHPFKTEGLSLAEALAASGGLSDGLADAGGVFLFRFESAEILQEAGVAIPEILINDTVATIYRLDFNEPEAFFLARSFKMQDNDLIYVANAFAAEYFKFIRIYVQPLLDISRTSSVLID